MDLVSIVVPVRFRADLTQVCLDSVIKYTKVPYELILVQEGEDEEITRLLKSYTDNFVQNREPKGFAGAMNSGLALAKGKYICFLNSDTVVTPNWLSSIVDLFSKDKRIGLITPTYTEMPRWQRISKEPEKDFIYIDNATTLKGVCFVIRKSVLDEIGSWDESFGIGGGDDNDLAIRVKKASYELAVARKSYIYHYGSASFKELFNEDVNYARKFADGQHNKFMKKHNLKEKPKVYIAVLTMGSLRKELSNFLIYISHDFRYQVKITYHGLRPASYNRNNIVKEFLKTDCDFLLKIDHDNVPMKNPLDLIALDKDVVGFPYPQIKGNELGWLIMRRVEGGYKQMPTETRQGLQEVDATGDGVMLIARRVLEQVKIPFEREWKDGVPIKGSDFYFCLPPNQYIYSDNLKYIQDIKKGDYIASAKVQTTRTKVLKKFCRKYKGEVIDIEPFYYEKISLTPEHKILVKRWFLSGKKQILKKGSLKNKKNVVFDTGHMKNIWIEAKDVRKGDLVKTVKSIRGGRFRKKIMLRSYLLKETYIAKGKYIYLNRNPIADYLGDYSASIRLPRAIYFNELFAKFLGYYIAEGCVSNGTIDISSNDKNRLKEHIEPFISWLGMNYKYKKLKNNWHLYFCSKLFGEFLKNFVGSKSNNKHLPDFWYQLSEKTLSLLIKSYWDGDGCHFKHIRKKYKNYSDIFICNSVSNQLIREIKFALTRFDILSTISTKKFDNKNWKDSYELKIISYFNSKFAKLLGVKIKNNKKIKSNLHIHGKRIWVRVKRVKRRKFSGKVYNLETKNNTYNCNGIVIHNCDKAKDLGFKIWTHWDYPADHVKEVSLIWILKLLGKNNN